MKHKTLADQWRSYAEHVVPRSAPKVQMDESRKAFYAGAFAIFECIMVNLDPGSEPTDGDLSRMDALYAELTEFIAQAARS